MEAVLFLYFAGIVRNLSVALGTLTFINFIGLIICVFGWATGDIPKNFVYVFLSTFLMSGTLTALVPPEKTVYYMAGGYLAQEALTSDIAKDTYKIIELKVQKYKEEMIQDITNKHKESK